MKIAIQGQAASYHAIAAQRLFKEEVELVHCDTFKDVFKALQRNDAEKAVVAIENSLYGSINDVYDLLLKYSFWVEAEVYEQISLELLAPTGSRLKEITDVYSQAPALAEAEEFLDAKLPVATRHEYFDTAAAAEYVAKSSNKNWGAIASRAAAKTYKLDLVAENVETHHLNYTRFIALSRNEQVKEQADKTSITFRTADKPGSLYAALGVFAKNGINLSKLESRPIVGEVWQYMYYIDFAAGMNDQNALNALKNLEQYASSIRVLGSYKAGEMLKA